MDDSEAQAIDALIDRFIAAIERADVDAVVSMYAPNARIWHNFDQIEMSPQDNAKQVRWFATRLSNMRYEDIRRTPFPGGLFQQHVLRGTAPNGEAVEVFAALRIEVDLVTATITCLEEYLDPAQAASLAKPAPK